VVGDLDRLVSGSGGRQDVAAAARHQTARHGATAVKTQEKATAKTADIDMAVSRRQVDAEQLIPMEEDDFKDF
jgi:hypothetical protein